MFGRLSASRGAIAAGLVAVMLAAVALMPGSFSPALAQTAGKPPPPPPAVVKVTVVVNGNTETIVTTPGGLASVVLPPGSAVSSISLTVTTTPTSANAEADVATLAVTDFVSNLLGGTAEITGLSSRSEGETVELAYVFHVSFGDSVSNARQSFVMGAGAMLQLPQQSLLQTGTELSQPATGMLNVLPETLAQAGGDLRRLAVYFVDPASGTIEPVKMLPSPGPGQLAFEFTKPGAYAVLVSVITLDATVAPVPANTGIVGSTTADRTGTYALLAGTVLATIALGGLGLRFARRRA